MREFFSIDPKTGLIRAGGITWTMRRTGVLEIDVQARDLGPNPIPAHCKVTVKLIDPATTTRRPSVSSPCARGR